MILKFIGENLIRLFSFTIIFKKLKHALNVPMVNKLGNVLFVLHDPALLRAL